MKPREGDTLLFYRKNNDLKKARTKIFVLAMLVAGSVQAASSDVAVVGPVDGFSCRLRSISVLGISLTAKDRSVVQAVCSSNPEPGLSYVAVTGELDSSGIVELKSFKLLSDLGYVPGSSAIYVRGIVTASDPLTGNYSIGGAQVAGAEVPPPIGTFIEVLGSQPIARGIILSQMKASVDHATDSSAGTGLMSSAGTGKFSSSGTGLNSSAGTGLQSSAGTGLLSSVGTGVFSSSGTGLDSSAGTGVLSSSGTGVLSSSGTGVLSSSGTGVLKSAEAGVLSSSGTGVQSSAGTGVLSSAGTGF